MRLLAVGHRRRIDLRPELLLSDARRLDASLEALRRAAQGRENTMPHLIDAVRAYASVGEVCDALRQVWGEYVEEPMV